MRSLSIIVVVLLAGAHPVSSQTVTWKDDVGGWHIGIDDSVGYGCFMGMLFEKGTYLRFAINPVDSSMSFIIMDDNWRSIEAGKYYPVEVQFGRRAPWDGEAEGIDWGDGLRGLGISIRKLETAEPFIVELKRMRDVKVKYEGNTIAHLSLRGSFVAVDEMLNCQANVADSMNAGKDPFGKQHVNNNDPFF